MKVEIAALLFLMTVQHGVNSFTIYDARLNGSSVYQGAVEILTDHGWLPVCERYTYTWDYREVGVICRQLGYKTIFYSTRSTNLSTPSVDISFSCSGTELKLSQCLYTFNGEFTSCSSRKVTVYCAPCTNGSVQLLGGIVPEAGTVVYCNNGEWKAVCHNSWDYKDAFVVCRQLGFPATDARRYQNSYFGVSHPYQRGINFVNCFGNETSLANCIFTVASCSSESEAGVYCRGNTITDLCVNGHLRLAGGKSSYEGRVEICSNGVWGTIWTGGWDSLDAKVVCKELGLYQTYSRIEVFYNYFGAGTGPVLYTYLNCDGTESALTACRSSTSSNFYFGVGHYDAGVRCNRTVISIRSNCLNGDVRLVNGTTSYEGRVEICYDGIWGSVCDIGWDNSDAVIVCQQIGFKQINATALRWSYFGSGDGPYHLGGVSCRGNERTLLQCPHGRSIGYHTCSPGHDAGVRCDVTTICNHGEVRLFGGYSDQDGIAKVCINGKWAGICYNILDQTTVARVFCRQLIGREPRFFTSSCCSRQRNGGNFTLYNVSCNDQLRGFVQDCTYNVILEYNTAPASGCTLYNELLVGCYEQSSCIDGDLRLRDGNSTHQGRVELCNQRLWGAISISSWNYQDASVVCRQLGYPWEWARAENSNLFGRGDTRIVARNFRCNRYEQQLLQCTYSNVSLLDRSSYQQHTAAGVICQGNTSAPTECQHGDARLVNGHNRTEGRLEVCTYGYWAIACDVYWDIIVTDMVCKQLGLPANGAMHKFGSPFESNYQLPVVGVYCGAGGTNLSECQFYTLAYNSYCNHRKSIGIYCQEQELLQHYYVRVAISPVQESYEIGSRVTFNCTVTPVPIHREAIMLSYRWTSAGFISTLTHSSKLTVTIPNYHTDSAEYYCQPLYNGQPLGTGKVILRVKDLLQRNVSGTSDGSIQVDEQGTLNLQVETSPADNNILRSLLGLTWYHNSVILRPNCDTRITLSNNNKTLTITNFTFADGGIYIAQFDQLFVHPYNKDCEDKVLSIMRHLPVLKPAMFCVNVEGECSDNISGMNFRRVSVKAIDSDLLGTFNSITLKADGKVFSSEELQYSFYYWYRTGSYMWLRTPTQKYCNNLTLSQRFQQFNTSYVYAGRYEVQLRMYMYSYLRFGDNTVCRSYYNQFISSFYYSSLVTLAKGYINEDYHKDLSFDLDANKKATTRSDGATLTCRASIQFPPFSMLSFIKNGQAVATSSSGLLQINIKNVKANPFGLYMCQLNASGVVFQKSVFIKEQANIRITVNGGSCTKSAVEDALKLKIRNECHCTFDLSDFHDSSIDCKGNNELIYTAILKYSTDNGAETAAIIAERLISQAPFVMMVNKTVFTVTDVCSDCRTLFSSAAGGGLFAGGFVAAILIIGILLVIIMVVVKKRHSKSMKISENEQDTNADRLRYSPGAQRSSYSKSVGKIVDLHFPKDEMPPIDQPIYEETF